MRIGVKECCLGLVALSMWACASAQSIEGTWQLVHISPLAVEHLDPTGIANRKERYADGRLMVVPPDGTSADATSVRYSFANGVRTLFISAEVSVTSPVEFDGDNRMLLRHGDHEVWTYERLADGLTLDSRLPPYSVEQLASDDVKDDAVAPAAVAKFQSPPPPESAASTAALTGVWEVVRYANLPKAAVTPYGMPNDKYAFSADQLCIVPPGVTQSAAENCHAYALENDELVIRPASGESLRYRTSINEWSYLTLGFADATIELRKISSDPNDLPKLPVTIVLLDLPWLLPELESSDPMH